jgi:hypothetical protein
LNPENIIQTHSNAKSKVFKFNRRLHYFADQVTSVTAVTEQHLLRICLAATEPTLGVHDGLGPDDGVVEGGEVEEELAHVGAPHQAQLPPLERSQGALLPDNKISWMVFKPMLWTVLRIRIFPYRIPDPGSKRFPDREPHQRI